MKPEPSEPATLLRKLRSLFRREPRYLSVLTAPDAHRIIGEEYQFDTSRTEWGVVVSLKRETVLRLLRGVFGSRCRVSWDIGEDVIFVHHPNSTHAVECRLKHGLNPYEQAR